MTALPGDLDIDALVREAHQQAPAGLGWQDRRAWARAYVDLRYEEWLGQVRAFAAEVQNAEDCQVVIEIVHEVPSCWDRLKSWWRR